MEETSIVASRSPLSERQRTALMANPWFAALSGAIRDDMMACGRLRVLEAGQCLFRRGEATDGMYGVVQGAIRLSGTSRDGREAILAFFEPGSWIGEISTFDGLPRTHDAHAHVATVVLHIRVAEFDMLLARHPSLARQLLRLGCTRLRILLTAVEAFSTQSLEQRLAGRLLALSSAYGSATQQGVSIELQLSQEVLAQLIGSTRQRVNQLLKDWTRDGLVQQRYGRLAVMDETKLQAIAAG